MFLKTSTIFKVQIAVDLIKLFAFFGLPPPVVLEIICSEFALREHFQL